ncbi:MAG: cytochrome b/b6 domain-containing protein [Alphaproteobacteria bacterium]|nr:cytochrome b/b6 domain-containing protein [Alphaproteobacteria bacterium]MBU1514692.1 cytochrome b/b6 domain-containing protein [Alphaproteobacteria bacterium]MBU2093551.1 cytochrome b/b6 domain-containing protein [Alphaproteobacteria bacterium]MBU2149465.1 cytochrome b/b6 domain-containing protein [Alphaproteobacteria bacterium]MBU2305492.1 cytochrome b/b6 domain-containing protein [Alphaproteobacteria bacterium]
MKPFKERTRRGATAVYRHPVLVRATHWVNALCLLVLLLSGLQILNAHPAFYWGEVARFAHPIAAIDAVPRADGELRGRMTVAGATFDTTGVLGASKSGGEQLQARAFPSWLTLPGYLDLGAGRRWHFFFAWALVINGLIYAAFALASGRIRGLIWPSLGDLRGIVRDIWDHLRLRFAHGDAGYNVLQKLAYAAVIFGLLPLMLLTGLVMSPAVYARLPILGDLLGGRQSARTLHFLAASGLVSFVVVHLAMVVAAGPVNEIRSMITGWFVIRREKKTP